MELDDFKDMWTRSAGSKSTINYNLTELIYRDSKSPLAMLEKKYRTSIYIFPFVVILFSRHLFAGDANNRHLTTWLLFTILFIEFMFSLFNYLLIKKTQQPAGNIRENLLKRVFLLENRTNNFLYINLGLYILMAITLELSLHFHLDYRFNGWATVNPWLRVAAYVIFLALQFVIKRKSQKRQYGQYIDKLNSLIAQME